MKKYLLLCSLVLVCTIASVGKASNAAKTEKTLVLDSYRVPESVQSFEGFDLVLIVENTMFIQSELAFSGLNLVFLEPLPVSIDLNRDFSNIEYKQKGKIKTKYHSDHLFNPVKIC